VRREYPVALGFAIPFWLTKTRHIVFALQGTARLVMSGAKQRDIECLRIRGTEIERHLNVFRHGMSAGTSSGGGARSAVPGWTLNPCRKEVRGHAAASKS